MNPIVGGMIAISALLIISIYKAFQRPDVVSSRSIALQALSEKLAFSSFSPEPNYEFVMGWGFLGYLAQGEDRYAFNILEGTYQDQKLFVFDYHFKTGNREDNDRYCSMFMLIEQEYFPQVVIEPVNLEDIFSRIANVFTNSEIKFESAEFSRTYRVRSSDKKFAYDVCNPQMMDYLLANGNLRIEIQGPVILLAHIPQAPVEAIEPGLQTLAQIRSLLPQYLFTTK
ncbi:MAG TPA: hypothetical protein VMH87_15110 [Pseudomonadales bacterium]|nr:hypothetical protein [Pseudomonadales bacterium]